MLQFICAIFPSFQRFTSSSSIQYVINEPFAHKHIGNQYLYVGNREISQINLFTNYDAARRPPTSKMVNQPADHGGKTRDEQRDKRHEAQPAPQTCFMQGNVANPAGGGLAQQRHLVSIHAQQAL